MIACWFHLGDPPGYAESIAYKSPNQTVCYQWCWPLLLLLLTSRMHQYSVPQSLVRPTFLGTDMQRTLRAIPRHITHARLRTRTSQHKKWAQLFLKTDLFVGGKQTRKPSTHHSATTKDPARGALKQRWHAASQLSSHRRIHRQHNLHST